MAEETALRLDETEIKKLRNRLESVFLSLNTIHSVLIVGSEALKAQSADYDPEIACVVIRCAADPLHRELEELTTIIEGLGGKTAYSEERDNGEDS